MRFAAAILLLLLAGCGQSFQWTGWVYPSAGNLTHSVEIGRFDTFEQCRASAVNTLAAFGRTDSGAFECGRACRRSESTGLNICAETRD
jgi:hypothetical protein